MLCSGLKHGNDLCQLLLFASIEAGHIQAFHNALEKSGKESVDSFLEHRQEFLTVGRTAIAAVLLPLERPQLIFPHFDKNHWLQYLFGSMNATMEEFQSNKLAIVTFNYDRVVEYFFQVAIENLFGIPTAEAEQAVSRIEIVHVHGSLGPLSGTDACAAIPFGAKPVPETLRLSAASIKIIHEAIAISQEFQHARQLIAKAQAVCFLRFGFDHTNLSRLGAPANFHTSMVYGSAFGFTKKEADAVKDSLGNRSVLVDIEHGDCLEFIRHNVSLR